MCACLSPPRRRLERFDPRQRLCECVAGAGREAAPAAGSTAAAAAAAADSGDVGRCACQPGYTPVDTGATGDGVDGAASTACVPVRVPASGSGDGRSTAIGVGVGVGVGGLVLLVVVLCFCLALRRARSRAFQQDLVIDASALQLRDTFASIAEEGSATGGAGVGVSGFDPYGEAFYRGMRVKIRRVKKSTLRPSGPSGDLLGGEGPRRSSTSGGASALAPAGKRASTDSGVEHSTRGGSMGWGEPHPQRWSAGHSAAAGKGGGGEHSSGARRRPHRNHSAPGASSRAAVIPWEATNLAQLCRLHHPNCVAVYGGALLSPPAGFVGLTSSGGGAVLQAAVEEFLPSGTLEELLISRSGIAGLWAEGSPHALLPSQPSGAGGGQFFGGGGGGGSGPFGGGGLDFATSAAIAKGIVQGCSYLHGATRFGPRHSGHRPSVIAQAHPRFFLSRSCAFLTLCRFPLTKTEEKLVVGLNLTNILLTSKLEPKARSLSHVSRSFLSVLLSFRSRFPRVLVGTAHAVGSPLKSRRLGSDAASCAFPSSLLVRADPPADPHIRQQLYQRAPHRLVRREAPPCSLPSPSLILLFRHLSPLTLPVLSAPPFPPRFPRRSAPEYICGEATDPTTSADVYAFGLISYSLFSGNPFPLAERLREQPLPDVLKAVAERDLRPDFPGDVPKRVRDIAADCWHRNPRRRPPFSEVAVTLREALEARGRGRKPLIDSVVRFDPLCASLSEALTPPLLLLAHGTDACSCIPVSSTRFITRAGLRPGDAERGAGEGGPPRPPAAPAGGAGDRDRLRGRAQRGGGGGDLPRVRAAGLACGGGRGVRGAAGGGGRGGGGPRGCRGCGGGGGGREAAAAAGGGRGRGRRRRRVRAGASRRAASRGGPRGGGAAPRGDGGQLRRLRRRRPGPGPRGAAAPFGAGEGRLQPPAYGEAQRGLRGHVAGGAAPQQPLAAAVVHQLPAGNQRLRGLGGPLPRRGQARHRPRRRSALLRPGRHNHLRLVLPPPHGPRRLRHLRLRRRLLGRRRRAAPPRGERAGSVRGGVRARAGAVPGARGVPRAAARGERPRAAAAVPPDDEPRRAILVHFHIPPASLLRLCCSAALPRATGSRNLPSSLPRERTTELRTPLNSVIGFATLALEDPALPPRSSDFLRDILAGASTLLSLITRVLEYSRLSSNIGGDAAASQSAEPLRLRSLVAELADIVGPRAQLDDVDLFIELDRALYKADADAEAAAGGSSGPVRSVRAGPSGAGGALVAAAARGRGREAGRAAAAQPRRRRWCRWRTVARR